MAIYGTALLAFCLLTGLLVGKLIGRMVGIDDNVGGVGIAMLLLVVISGHLQSTGRMAKPTQNGVLFWSSIYIPIVVAMAASQNVLGAVSSGLLAIVAGAGAVVLCFALVPVISRLGQAVDTVSIDETDIK
jgi:malonate transporter MadL subunit